MCIRDRIRADEDRVRELDLEISGRRNAMMNAMNDKASIGARNQRFETLLEQNQVRKSELSKQLLQIRSEEEVQNDVIGRLEAQIRENREMEEACRKKEEEMCIRDRCQIFKEQKIGEKLTELFEKKPEEA